MLLIPYLCGDELLAAVNVVGCAGEGGVGHDVYGKCRDILRSHDPAYGECGAKLLAPIFKLIAEQLSRQRCVDESGGDEVDPDGRELDSQVSYHRWKCRRKS